MNISNLHKDNGFEEFKDLIIGLIEEDTGIKMDITKRVRPHPYLRAIFFQVSIDLLTSQNIPQRVIADMLGKDHATVIHARDKIMPMLEFSEPFFYKAYLRVRVKAKSIIHTETFKDKTTKAELAAIIESMPEDQWTSFKDILAPFVLA
jgi:hypothetical protein